MLPLARVPMLRSVLVRMPRQALAALSVMEPVMGRVMGQGNQGIGPQDGTGFGVSEITL